MKGVWIVLEQLSHHFPSKVNTAHLISAYHRHTHAHTHTPTNTHTHSTHHTEMCEIRVLRVLGHCCVCVDSKVCMSIVNDVCVRVCACMDSPFHLQAQLGLLRKVCYIYTCVRVCVCVSSYGFISC